MIDKIYIRASFFSVKYRDAVNDLALHFLDKMKIMVVKDIEREDVEFVCKVSQLQLCDQIIA